MTKYSKIGLIFTFGLIFCFNLSALAEAQLRSAGKYKKPILFQMETYVPSPFGYYNSANVKYLGYTAVTDEELADKCSADDNNFLALTDNRELKFCNEDGEIVNSPGIWLEDTEGNVWLANVDNKVGIGTATPLAKLHLEKDGSILAVGDAADTDAVPASGAGTRLMWMPSIGALRAGYLDSNGAAYWDSGQIGAYSLALGFNTQAYATSSVALGSQNRALGQRSLVAGGDSNAADTTALDGVILGGSGNTVKASGGAVIAADNVTLNSSATNTVVLGYPLSTSGATVSASDIVLLQGKSIGVNNTSPTATVDIDGNRLVFGETYKKRIAVGDGREAHMIRGVVSSAGKLTQQNNSKLKVSKNGTSYEIDYSIFSCHETPNMSFTPVNANLVVPHVSSANSSKVTVKFYDLTALSYVSTTFSFQGICTLPNTTDGAYSVTAGSGYDYGVMTDKGL